jgi:hypothetical protein
MTAVAILVVAALLLVPGAGAALAIAAPGAIAVETRIAFAFAFSYALVAGIAILLAIAHALTTPVFVAGVVLATAAVWMLLWRRRTLRAHGVALAAQVREEPFTLAAGLAVLLAVAATRPFFPPGLNLAHSSPWRYWADGLEIAAAGNVPTTTDQWGMELAPTTSKVVLNAFEGSLSLLLGLEPLPAMQGILAVAAVGVVAAFLAVGRELGFGPFAPLVPALAALAPTWLPLAEGIANDLDSYNAENVGRMVAFSVLAGAIAFSRLENGWTGPVALGLTAAMGALTHLIPAAVAGAMLLTYLVASFLYRREGLRQRVRLAGAGLATFLVAIVGVLVLSGGDLGFQGAARRAELTRIPPNVDATRSFAEQRLVPVKDRDRFYISPKALAARHARSTVGSDSNRTAVVALVCLAIASVLTALLARSLIPAVAVPWGLSALILLVALAFSYRYSTKIPGTFGPRRLSAYGALIPALIVPGFLAAIAFRFRLSGRAVAAALALTVAAFGVAAAVERIPGGDLPNAAAGRAAAVRVAENVPCGERMLANARTAGTWEALTGRRAILEGMAPYLRPEVLDRVLPLLLEARRFFADPEANADFLDEQRVDYVVVVAPAPWIGTSPEEPKIPTDAAAIAGLPGVATVHRDANLTVFATSSAEVPRGSLPALCPL